MRMWHWLALSLGLLLPAACGKSTSVDLPFAVQLQQVLGSGLSSPIDLQAPPGDSRLFIAERPGRIRVVQGGEKPRVDRKSTRLNSSHGYISYAVFCLKKKKKDRKQASL